MTAGIPTVFVSYSWDDAAHKTWVRDFFTNGLRSRGVDAVVDWHNLTYGDRADEFMERLASVCDHVAVICTPNYAERARSDQGGIGYEKVLIKQFLQRNVAFKRVVPILRRGDNTAVPAFLGSRLYADMRQDGECDEILDELAALFYGQQLHPAAPVAPPPDWLKGLLS